jgi:phage virion morphogenesis protein
LGVSSGNVKSGTGVKFRVTADTRAIGDALKRLEGDQLRQAALKNIGEVLLNATRRRFNAQVAPDGTPWKPVNPLYAGTAEQRAGKTKGIKKGTKILQASGQLLMSIHPQVTPGQLQIGTNKIYAAIHQFGGVIVPKAGDSLVFMMGGQLIHAKKVTIPARPFLGIAPADAKEAIEAVEEIAAAKWSGPP